MTNSHAHSPATSLVITRCSPHSVHKSHQAAHASNAPSLTFLRWGCVSQRTCLSSTLKVSTKLIYLGRNGNSRRYCHHSHGRTVGKVTVPSPAAGLASKDLIIVSKWRTVFNCPWIFQSCQQLLGLVSAAKSSSGCWIRDYAAAIVTVLFVQAITAQDISHALSSTPPILPEPRLQQLMDCTISPCTKSGSISGWGARLSSVRCGAKKLPAGRTSPLLRLRPCATPTMIGSSFTRQVTQCLSCPGYSAESRPCAIPRVYAIVSILIGSFRQGVDETSPSADFFSSITYSLGTKTKEASPGSVIHLRR